MLGAPANERNFTSIVDWADGWLPVGGDLRDLAFANALGDLRRRWHDAGREGEPEICHFFFPGSFDEMAGQIEIAAQRNVQRMQVLLGERDRDDALPLLDELARAVTVAADHGRHG